MCVSSRRLGGLVGGHGSVLWYHHGPRFLDDRFLGLSQGGLGLICSRRLIPHIVLIYTARGIKGLDMKLLNFYAGTGELLARGVHWGLLAAVAGATSVAALAQTAPVPTAVLQMKAVGAAYELDGTVQPVKQSTVSAQI